MRPSKLLIVTALLLGLFFLVQFVAELSFFLAPAPSRDAKPTEQGHGLIDLALSSGLHTNAAFSLLEAGDGHGEEARVRQAMGLLVQAIRRNPLDYQARYYLSKAYLRFSAVDNNYFDLGVRELRRAATIRGSNRSIALECGRVFFSLWPLLENGDQEFTVELLSGVMPLVSWSEFSPLVEMWALYVQDVPMLMKLLQLKPDLFGPAANQLVNAGLPLAKRWEMLSLYEATTLDGVERRYNELNLEGGLTADDARPLLGQLRAIQGYFRLFPGSTFDSDKFLKLRRTLLLEVIKSSISGARDDPKKAAELNELIEYYIARHSGLNELDDLQKILDDRSFFKENDFSSLRLKTMIAYEKGDYAGIIAEIEALRKGISFVKKEQAADYTAILLMLVDSYYSSKLMTAAEAINQELYPNQPDNPDVLWRILRVENILGNEGGPDKELEAKLATIRDSWHVVVAKARVPYFAYLFNQAEVDVTIAPALRAGFKPNQLVQVFVNDKIAFESYAEGLPETVVIKPPFVEIESKVKVQINVL